MKREIRSNFRVVVYPQAAGTFPGLGSVGWVTESQDETLRRCEAIRQAVARHIDGIRDAHNHAQTEIQWDSQFVCSHCGSTWEVDDKGIPPCCDAAIAEMAAPAEATGVLSQ